MITIQVDSQKLLAQLKKNRDQHMADFQEARKGYRTVYVETLLTALHNAEQGRDIKRFPDASLPVPESHEEEYTRAIAMIEIADHQIALSETDFKRFWQDDWDWKASFSMGVGSYRENNDL